MTRKVDYDRRALFQGSDDPAIQLLVTPVRRRGADFASRTVGSMGGLAALSRGECHFAAAHLLDESTGGYNDVFIERFSNGRKWNRVLVFYRTQGIIVARGCVEGQSEGNPQLRGSLRKGRGIFEPPARRGGRASSSTTCSKSTESPRTK